jgi:hypothetical protein
VIPQIRYPSARPGPRLDISPDRSALTVDMLTSQKKVI